MIRFTKGNLLDADVEAVVNTVNTVGVMGKGIALMFKERFPENHAAYLAACKAGSLQPGGLLAFRSVELTGPRWIVNFATKKHWRQPSRLEWIESGLEELKGFLVENGIRTIAIPPLGCGNGRLNWDDVRPRIEAALGELEAVDIFVYEPTAAYQNARKRQGVESLTPARALIAEMVRRYGVLGIDCTVLEAQKLAWFLERFIGKLGLPDPLKLDFAADRYGPYAHRLTHLLNGLDGSYLHCEKRLADAAPFDVIWFEDAKRETVDQYLNGPEARAYRPALEATDDFIDGFQSPLGVEVLATVDWLVNREGAPATLEGITEGLRKWPAGGDAAERKLRLFTPRLVELSLQRLARF